MSVNVINLNQYYLKKSEIEEVFGDDDVQVIKDAIDLKADFDHTHDDYLTKVPSHTDSDGSYGKATTKVWGHTKLSSAIDSADETISATPKAVKTVYELANSKANIEYEQNINSTATGSYKIGTITIGSTETVLYGKDNNTLYSKGDGLLLSNDNVFSADFGTGNKQVARGDHTHSNYLTSVPTHTDSNGIYGKATTNAWGHVKLGTTEDTAAVGNHNHNSLYPQLNQIQYLNGSYYVNEGDIIQQKITIIDGLVSSDKNYIRVSINDLQNNQNFYVEGIEYTIEERNNDNILISFSSLSPGSYFSFVLSELKTNGYIYTGDRNSVVIQ